jgi:hypothetical protein
LIKQTDITRKGRWKPGESGNPAGRPPGGEVAKIRAAIAEHVPAIVEKLVQSALAGDAAAARLLLERVVPPRKPSEEPVNLPVNDGSLSDQGRAIFEAGASGLLAPGQVSMLLAGLGALAKVIETHELEQRIEALEAKEKQS